MEDRDGIRSALQADYESSTMGAFTLRDERRRMNMNMDKQNAVQKGLNAAKEAAREEGMAGKVEELSQRIGMSMAEDDAAAKDGFRADYDDSSDLM